MKPNFQDYCGMSLVGLAKMNWRLFLLS